MILRKTCIAASFLAFLVSLQVSEAADSQQHGYSTTTLRQPVFGMAQVAVESAFINNWLNANYEKLTNEQMKGPREHLYYLVDSYIKEIYQRDGTILPVGGDLILQTMLRWAEPLGVYGGALAYNAVKLPSAPKQESRLELPDSIALTLDRDLFTVRDELGSWEFQIPYYFMVFDARDFVPNGLSRTQLVSLSTGVAQDASEAGHSQATLMFMFSPNVDLREFKAYWLSALGISERSETKLLKESGCSSSYGYDESILLHKEVVFLESQHGALAVAYLGIDGTYQWNRIHFDNFVSSVETP